MGTRVVKEGGDTGTDGDDDDDGGDEDDGDDDFIIA